MFRRATAALAALLLSAGAAFAAPPPAAIDAAARAAMAETGVHGLALAVIEDGKVGYVQAYGARNAKGDPLQVDTVMYGASITKAAFADMVMQLVDEKRFDLDAPIASYLKKPLPDYPVEDTYDTAWSDLSADARWRKITPRILLTHSSGFGNYPFLEPDEKLHIHFEPGSRYAYSGEGLILLQFVLDHGLGLDVGHEMQRRIFTPFGMTQTSMTWRPDFAANLADGWDEEGKPHPHDERSRVRASGSMDTTITDIARFAAALVRGRGLSAAAHAEMIRPQLPITTAAQFPTLMPELPPEVRRRDLSAGLGVVTFEGPQGPGFYKGGHDEITGNMLVCLTRSRRCVVFLGNDVRIEKAYPRLVRFILGETGMPWTWEYGADAG